MGVSTLMVILFYAGGEVPIMIGALEKAQPIYTTPYLVWATVLAGVAVLLAIVFPIVQMIRNPKNIKKTLISLGFIVAIVVIGYIFASTEQLNLSEKMSEYNVPSTLRQVGTGLIATYILAAIALGSILYTEVSKIFK